ncbi:MAG: dienelactone hydrolase family protein, partial [candidate division Zixibacteria bacterium]|nr:dienelactone hydrolase family protein [candidate division Zixibacteria bacterium]
MIEITTPRGIKLSAFLNTPNGEGKFPAVVVAPGLGYNSTLPLFEKFSDQCIESGIICLRFEWDFYTKGVDPSDDYSDEFDDYSSAVEYLKGVENVNHSKIYIAGKSIGSLVAIEYAAQNPGHAGLILFTPPLHSPQPPYNLRKPMERIKDINIPITIIYGDDDPICREDQLEKFLIPLDNKPEVNQFGGNHSFKGASDSDTAKNLLNAVKAAVEFIEERAGNS